MVEVRNGIDVHATSIEILLVFMCFGATLQSNAIALHVTK